MRRAAWALVALLASAGCSAPPPGASHGPDRSWHRLADAPFPDHAGGVFVAVGGKLVVLGGTRYIDCDGMMSCPIGTEIREMAAYDPAHDRWDELPDLPSALSSQPEVTTIGDRLIATSGGHFQVFDLSTEDWRSYPGPPLDPVNADHLLAHGHSVYILSDPSNPQSPVQRLDLADGVWTVLTRQGLGAATTRSIFWTEVGLVSAGYDSSSGDPVPAVARFHHGSWRRFPAPPEPISPATYRLWGGGVAMPGPRHGAPQYLDVVRGRWFPIPHGTMTFDRRGLPTSMDLGAADDEDLALVDGVLYALSARSQLRERALFTR